MRPTQQQVDFLFNARIFRIAADQLALVPACRLSNSRCTAHAIAGALPMQQVEHHSRNRQGGPFISQSAARVLQPSALLMQQPVYHLLHRSSVKALRQQRDWPAALVDEELEKVPTEVAARAGAATAAFSHRQLSFEEFVHRVRATAVDLHFAEHGEGHMVPAGAELLDLRLTARFLVAKLVAWEAEDLEPMVVVLLVRLLQPGIVLVCEPARRRDVDDDNDLASVARQRHNVAVYVHG
mmetsp:Transcript_8742/g.26493  ORF Transcript_8742/g.26493 Transcript_8742/m.26493 type:complete len:239 (-) Transcript_8742:702-1418(-)